jgi:orotate phosphoribosyltransferase-like protein
MNQIDQIKELQRQGLGPQEIAGRLSLNRKTVAKYIEGERLQCPPHEQKGSGVETGSLEAED